MSDDAYAKALEYADEIAELMSDEVACQGCGKYGAPNVCSHGKNICEDCFPDLCWGCNADSETEGPTW